jgi:molybdate transport repressor ModE-like protein
MQETTNQSAAAVHTKIKLTLCKEERYFGPGICELLEKIDETGSIQAAARQMNMSYTKAWKILNRAEKEMNCQLTIRLNGGKSGGSSSLTREGREAVTAFRELEQRLLIESERLLTQYAGVLAPRPQEMTDGGIVTDE